MTHHGILAIEGRHAGTWLAILTLVALLAFGSAGTVSAHEDHTSCRLFGRGTAAFAQAGPPGSFGAFVATGAPSNDDIAFLHALECEPK